MVNLVIVSHSHGLAEGVKELADQMANRQIQIAAVGGVVVDDRPPTLGTDAVRISQSVSDVWTDDGVLILVDLGSAILSTELALEMLPERQQRRCLISNAPLVEGAVIAALEASMDNPLEKVNEAAEAANSYPKVIR